MKGSGCPRHLKTLYPYGIEVFSYVVFFYAYILFVSISAFGVRLLQLIKSEHNFNTLADIVAFDHSLQRF